MGARTRRFTSLASGSGKATAVVVCAVMLLAGCGGSGGSASEAGAPVVRGDVAGGGCEAAKNSWTATAAVGGVTRTVVFTAPTYTSPWTKFIATANTGQSATISTSASRGSIQVRGLTKKANNTFIVTGVTANGCSYTSPPSTTVSGAIEVLAAPAAPATPTVAVGDGRVTVTVAAPTAGGTPASYKVTAAGNAARTCTVSGASGSCDVTGLTNGTAYTFTATATNSGGTSAVSGASQPVTPRGTPGKPGIGVVAATGGTTADVAFTAPSSDGGSPITSYTATSTPAGGTGTLSQSGSGTIAVTGLTNGTSYTFTVTATNVAGTSLSSTPSTSTTTFNVPGAPGIGAVTATGGTTANVAFTAPSSNGGSTITSYTATSTPAGGTGTVSQSGSGTIAVTGLTASTTYTFTVTATNTAGTSVASAPSSSVTTVYSLGDTGPGGGVVFYVSTSGFTSDGSACGTSCKYLEVSRTDLAMSAWCSINTPIPGTTGRSIGSGFSNTRNMISGGCTNGAGVAARAFSGGGLSDWFLPSSSELLRLRAARAAVGGLATYPYWSSSTDPYNWQMAGIVTMESSGSESTVKGYELNVRAVRAF